MAPAAKDLQRRTVTIQEAARMLGIGRDQAYTAARTGQLPAIKIGKRLLVPKDALERMLSGEKPSSGARVG